MENINIVCLNEDEYGNEISETFSTSTHSYYVYSKRTQNEFNIPHFCVRCIKGTIPVNSMIVERPDIEGSVYNDDLIIPFDESMVSYIYICLNNNMYLSEYSDKYFLDKHPIIKADPEFLSALNKWLREEDKNGHNNWDTLCIMDSHVLCNNDYGWTDPAKFAKECPNYTENMIMIWQ